MTPSLDTVWDPFWRSTCLLASVLLAAQLFRHRLLARQALLQCGLIGLLLLPVAMFVPRLPWQILPAAQVATRVDSKSQPDLRMSPVASEPVLSAIPPLSQAPQQTPTELPPKVATNHVDLPTAVPVPRSEPFVTAVPSKTGNAEPATKVLSSPVSRPRLTGMHAIVAIYLAGLLTMLARFAVGLWQLKCLGQDSTPLNDAAWHHDLDACRLNQGITQLVTLRSAAHVSTPLTYGWLRPVLIVPATVAAHCTVAERRAILLHELIHIQRHDFAWICLLQLARTLYWCHPLTWIFCRHFTATQEDVCDAICVGEFGAQQYSEALVSVAKTTHRSAALTLGLAMSRASRLSQRLARIQEQGCLSISQLPRLGWYGLLVLALPVGLATMLVQPLRAQPAPAAPQPPSEPATAKEVTAGPTKAPATSLSPTQPAATVNPAPQPATPHVVFQLQDPEQQPLKSTAARIRRFREIKGTFEFDPTDTEFTSDSNGVITIPLNDVQATDKEVGFEVFVPGRAPQMEGFEVTRASESPTPKAVRLLPSTTLKTRVFDAQNQPVSGARVTISADIDHSMFDIWHSVRFSDADGNVDVIVPRDKVFGIKILSDRGAPYRLVCPAGTERLSEVHLPRGCTVSGQLLDRAGKPVPNCMVVLEGEDSQAVRTQLEVQRYGGGSIDLEFRRRTDAEGKFRFPPMEGDVRVYVDCNANTRPPQIIIPISVRLPDAGDKWMPLILAPTGQVTGTVRWPDGKPVPKLHLEVLVPPNLSNAYITLFSTETNAQGQYSLDVPFPLEQARISGYGATGPDGKYWEVQPVTVMPEFHERRWQPIERYLGEPLNVDWVMIPRDETGNRSVAGSTTVEPQWEPLAKLESEIEAALQAYRAAPQNDARDKLDPRYVMVDRCLAFEAEHRGTRLAIGALHYVMRAAATTTSPIVNTAREKAITVLGQHYLKHPDLDLLIDEFDAGSSPANAEELLARVAEESPFDYIRATAMLELAEHWFDLLHLAEHVYNTPLQPEAEFADLVKMQTSESTREWLLNQRADSIRLRTALKDVKPDALRQRAIQLLDRVVNNYVGVKAPRRRWQAAQPGHKHYELQLVEWNEHEEWRRRTIAERAEIRRFQQTRLRIGMFAPEIEGRNLQQQPIRLSQFQGKVVLLAVGVDSSEAALNASFAQVAAKFAGQSVQCVSVISGSGGGGYSVRAIVENSKITWPIIRDTAEDDIQARWCQQTFPEMYIIDQQGIIRDHEIGNSISPQHLESLIERTVQSAKKPNNAPAAP